MKSFQYTITAEEGLHARPAGLLTKCAQGLSSDIAIACNGRNANAKKLFAIMGLAVKKGDTVQVAVSGDNEEKDVETIGAFCEQNL